MVVRRAYLKDVATELGVHRDGELICAPLRWLVLDAWWFMSAPVPCSPEELTEFSSKPYRSGRPLDRSGPREQG
jgi:hypothetical protein